VESACFGAAGRADDVPERDVVFVDGALRDSVFGAADAAAAATCQAACAERGTPLELFEAGLARLPPGEEFAGWLSGCQKAEVGFVSYHDGPVALSWVGDGGRLYAQGTLNYGEKYTIWRTSFLGHTFHASLGSAEGEVVLRHTVRYNEIVVMGQPRPLAAHITEKVRRAAFVAPLRAPARPAPHHPAPEGLRAGDRAHPAVRGDAVGPREARVHRHGISQGQAACGGLGVHHYVRGEARCCCCCC